MRACDDSLPSNDSRAALHFLVISERRFLKQMRKGTKKRITTFAQVNLPKTYTDANPSHEQEYRSPEDSRQWKVENSEQPHPQGQANESENLFFITSKFKSKILNLSTFRKPFSSQAEIETEKRVAVNWYFLGSRRDALIVLVSQRYT